MIHNSVQGHQEGQQFSQWPPGGAVVQSVATRRRKNKNWKTGEGNNMWGFARGKQHEKAKEKNIEFTREIYKEKQKRVKPKQKNTIQKALNSYNLHSPQV